jgi:trans-aconitate methyltransferase
MGDEATQSPWQRVWSERGPSTIGFNGFEAHFPDIAAYRSFVEHEAEFVIDILDLGPHDRVVDLGCGTGVLASLVASRVQWIVAIDRSETVLAAARAAAQLPNVEYRLAELATFDPASVDVNKAMAVSSLHYLDRYETARDLIRRLLDAAIRTAVVDVPDVRFRDRVVRDYDTTMYPYVYFDEERLRADFGNIAVYRGRLPMYANDAVRFSFVCSP